MTRAILSSTPVGNSTLRGLLCAAILALSLPLPHDASAASLQVDDDGVQCPGAGFTTIQAAVTAAAAGDTIKVCPGSYAEQVTIDKALKIKGKAPKYKDCNTLGAPDPTRARDLSKHLRSPGLGGIGIDVLASGVRIQNIVVTHAGETGIRTDPAYAGFSLKKSRLHRRTPTACTSIRAALPESSVKANCFRKNGFAGIRTRYGLKDAVISKNLFFETTNAAAIIVDQEPGSTTDRLEVIANKSQGDSTFAVILGTVDSVFAKNTVDSTVGTAIFVGGNNVNLEISKNTVTNAGTRGIRFNTAAFGGSANTGVLVANNVVDKAGVHGIAIDSSTGETTLTSSTIEKNTVTNSGQSGSGDGIRIEDPTASGANTGNTIDKNTISGSFNHDCHDDTPNTGNTWTGNTATTQSVANLCFSGPANGTVHVVCGDNVVGPGEQCDEGIGNSDAPDATCRTDCRVQRCGDGILDAGAGEACEADSDCVVSESCFNCACATTATLLGELPFSVIPGPSVNAPVDDGQSTWLKVTSLVPGINNGSQGNFNSGPLLLAAGAVDGNGIAPLLVKQTAYIGANAPAAGGGGKVCFRIEQDPSNLGFVDCDGGSNVDASLMVNSHGTSANDVPALTVGGGGDSGAGAAVIRVLVTGALSSNPTLACEDANYTGAPFTVTAFTTGTAAGTILNPRQGGASIGHTLAGQPFNCANWVENSGASIVMPNTNMDVTVPLLGNYDIVQTWRLNDD